mmetsp:Transcript_7158/g.11774  ORF Transcript_7158/g.11774 Transcript_7158/m.11774 type:complete len:227 (+) Transcript_7158:2576-3256(+)
MRRSSVRSCFDFSVRCIQAAKADVFPRAVSKDHRVLRHQRHMLAKVVPLHVLQRHTVKLHLPVSRVIKALDHLYDGGFTGAGRTNKGNGFTGLNGQVHRIQSRNIWPRRVLERHVVKPDFTFDRRRQSFRVGRIDDTVFSIEQLHQTFRSACGALQLTPDLRQGTDCPCHHHGINHKLHENAHAHTSGAHVACAHPKHNHHAGEDQENHNHREQCTGVDPAHGCGQ